MSAGGLMSIGGLMFVGLMLVHYSMCVDCLKAYAYLSILVNMELRCFNIPLLLKQNL